MINDHILIHTELSLHTLNIWSLEADTKRQLFGDQLTSLIPFLCPFRV